MKNNQKILIGLLLVSLATLIFQYVQILKTEGISAITIGTHNPGHLWSEMECSDSICIDAQNKRVGIGGENEPSVALDVSGTINATGDICITGTNKCLSGMVSAYNGECGVADMSGVTTVPSNANLCNPGLYSDLLAGSGSGPWSWICYGSGGGTSEVCSTLAYGTASGSFSTGNFYCPVSVSGSTLTFSGSGAGCHWGGYASIKDVYSKADNVYVSFEYYKPNGYDSNLQYALSLRLVADSDSRSTPSCGDGSGYYLPINAGLIWNNTTVDTSWHQVVIEINGPAGTYKLNSGNWTAIPNWSSVDSIYDLEFMDYGYGTGTSTSSIRNVRVFKYPSY